MKKLVIIFFLIISAKSFSQEHSLFINSTTKLITFERIYKIDTLKADFIFDKAKNWFIHHFAAADNVIKEENKPTIIKGVFKTSYMSSTGEEHLYYNDIEVTIKYGAIKLRVTNFKHIGMRSLSPLEEMGTTTDGSIKNTRGQKQIFIDIDKKCQKLSEELLKNISSKTEW